MAQPPTEIPFETALEQLETIVRKLEEGDLPLDESLRMFEDGVRLARLCSGKLDAAERKIEILMKSSEEGRVETAPFEPPSGDDGGRDA
jgi:exodeoxyribonuclease VII small subunit